MPWVSFSTSLCLSLPICIVTKDWTQARLTDNMPPPEDIKIPSSPTLKHYHAYRPASSHHYYESPRRSSASVNAAVSNLLHSEPPASTRSVASSSSTSPGFAVPRHFTEISFGSKRSVDSKYSNHDESQLDTNQMPTPISETAPTSLDDNFE